MAGDFVPEEDLNLKGFQKYFNSYTLRGRFNTVVATYSTIFLMVLLYKLTKPAKRNPPKPKGAGYKSPDVSPTPPKPNGSGYKSPDASPKCHTVPKACK